MSDWGQIYIKKELDSEDFWCLMDELYDDESGFVYNRRIILDAYKNGNLHVLRVNETKEMYKRCARDDSLFCKNSFYLLPCFCVTNEDKTEAIIIWTHTRARRKGFARKLVELLKIEYAVYPLPGSLEFWEKCNIKIKDKKIKNKDVIL